MRQIYENSATLSVENTFAHSLELLWACELKKLSYKYQLDYCCMRNREVVSWLELKCRSNHFLKYPTYMVSLDKWMKGIQLSEASGVPAFLAVRFTDADAYVRIGRGVGTVGYGGRTDRGDSQDVEPVVLVPMDKFKIIE